jgi:hypothetical protein
MRCPPFRGGYVEVSGRQPSPTATLYSAGLGTSTQVVGRLLRVPHRGAGDLRDTSAGGKIGPGYRMAWTPVTTGLSEWRDRSLPDSICGVEGLGAGFGGSPSFRLRIRSSRSRGCQRVGGMGF